MRRRIELNDSVGSHRVISIDNSRIVAIVIGHVSDLREEKEGKKIRSFSLEREEP